MKDLNELMQEILNMDAAQRKATEEAEAARGQALHTLAEQKAKLAQEYAEKAQAAATDVLKEKKQKCEADLAVLHGRQQAEAGRMAATAALQKDAWVKTLVQHVIEG